MGIKMMTDVQMKNKQLVEEYPFLMPRDWEDKPLEDYDYSFTILDEMPTGWRNAFGEQMCAEIKAALGPDLEKYRIEQVKEKFGELRWYTNWTSDALEDIIEKYAELSARTCISCGAPATKISIGWISPWCDECSKGLHNKFKSINSEKILDNI